jgi:hypothetical protein
MVYLNPFMLIVASLIAAAASLPAEKPDNVRPLYETHSSTDSNKQSSAPPAGPQKAVAPHSLGTSKSLGDDPTPLKDPLPVAETTSNKALPTNSKTSGVNIDSVLETTPEPAPAADATWQNSVSTNRDPDRQHYLINHHDQEEWACPKAFKKRLSPNEPARLKKARAIETEKLRVSPPSDNPDRNERPPVGFGTFIGFYGTFWVRAQCIGQAEYHICGT